MEANDMSPVVRLVDIMYGESWGATGESWERLNFALYRVLKAAITAGVRFQLTDFADIAAGYAFDFWGGNSCGYRLGEEFYAEACRVRNISAARSYEAWRGQKPFTWDGARIYIGRKFTWLEHEVECTSIAADGKSLTACAYRPETDDEMARRGSEYRDRVVARRFKITHETLRAEKKRLREG